MYRETSSEFSAFFPGGVAPSIEPPTVTVPAEKLEMVMSMARAAYCEGYRVGPAGEIMRPTEITACP